MKIEITEALWLDAQQPLTLAELTERSGLPQDLLRQLIELDALPATFDAVCLEAARTARRLHRDLELDAGALAVVLQLLSRVHALENELRALQAQLPRHLF
jgi:chaperone modulatory protein CbpM